uniref:OrfA protein n=1 Tax=Feline immunodeficiency virus TaxID=11673 RepID=A0A059U9N3_9RETR|nr:orfA protein [Feline immunodeficiency virus]
MSEEESRLDRLDNFVEEEEVNWWRQPAINNPSSWGFLWNIIESKLEFEEAIDLGRVTLNLSTEKWIRKLQHLIWILQYKKPKKPKGTQCRCLNCYILIWRTSRPVG